MRATLVLALAFGHARAAAIVDLAAPHAAAPTHYASELLLALGGLGTARVAVGRDARWRPASGRR